MTNPGIHAEMTILIRRENELEEKLEELHKKEIPLWEKRVGLAEQKGMSDLATQAAERVRELKRKVAEYQRELDSIDMQKSMLRKESRRPTGAEVERAENLLEQVRLAGLVDPDKGKWDELEEKARAEGFDEESGAVLDFGSDED